MVYGPNPVFRDAIALVAPDCPIRPTSLAWASGRRARFVAALSSLLLTLYRACQESGTEASSFPPMTIKLSWMGHPAPGQANEYGKCVTQNYVKAKEWYEKAANAGGTGGMSDLGHLYEHGLGLTKPDYEQALVWLSRAVSLNNSLAMLRLGYMYEKGWGLGQNYVEARHWYEKAAEAGIPTAMIGLGDFYRDGHGVQKDALKARELYQKAAKAGDPEAKQRLMDMAK